MSTQILDRITADPDQQERYARIALACLTIPGEPNPPAVRLTGTNEEIAVKILQENGFSASNDMDAAVQRAVELATKGRAA